MRIVESSVNHEPAKLGSYLCWGDGCNVGLPYICIIPLEGGVGLCGRLTPCGNEDAVLLTIKTYLGENTNY